MYNGIINIYKEASFTSHDVVAKMRGILKQKKIGHTGTLDPNAVGVLPVCLGNATKLCDLLTEKQKEYKAVLLLGYTSDTQDADGIILTQKKVQLKEEEVRLLMHSFIGDYAQIPPMYSALKVDGKKLYELARQGIEVERKPRMLTIYELEILSIDLPRIEFRVLCSKGTYIRTLCADIGEKLGCGGLMEHLERTKSGVFGLDTAITLSQLEQIKGEDQVEQYLIPTEYIFKDLKKVQVKPEFQFMLENGNKLAWEQLKLFGQTFENLEKVRIYTEKDMFLGVYEVVVAENLCKPYKMFFAK